MLSRIVNQWNLVRQCVALLAGERRKFAIFIVLSLLAGLSEGIGISLLAPLLDMQRGGGSPSAFAGIPLIGDVADYFRTLPASQWVQAVVIAIAVVVILRNALQYAVDVLGATIPQRLEQEFNRRSYDSLLAVELAYIQQRDSGTLLNSLSNWPQQVTLLLTNAATLIWNAITVAVYLVLMLLTSWQLTGAAFAFVIAISFALKWLTSNALRKTGQGFTLAVARVNQAAVETIAGMKAIRLSAAEPQMRRTFQDAIGEKTGQARRIALVQALSAPLMSTCAGLFICALLFASSLIHRGEPLTWIAPILLFLFLLFRLMGPISTINVARARVVTYMFAFEQLQKFYEETTRHTQPNGALPAPPIDRAITFDRVEFAYASGGRAALSNLSMTIDRGKMVAIVGPSGAGKTTLVGLITRLYEPQRGRILIDGEDLRDLEVRSWRRRLAVVAQDTFIFNTTVRANIAFGRGDVSIEHIREAARLAAAHDFIEALPQGYDTVLGDRGVRLSGGQQQRIAIARAILADPDLLILDEATSNLDTINERAIQNAISALSGNRTLLVIAHRLSTIRRADKVVVMDAGRIVEQGRHQELLARRGAYWEMVEHQRLDLVDGNNGGNGETAAVAS